jgi:hypothetical protein
MKRDRDKEFFKIFLRVFQKIDFHRILEICGYGLDDRGSRIRFPAGAGNFSLHRVQNGFGAHPVSYSMGIRGSFLGVKRPGREADH